MELRNKIVQATLVLLFAGLNCQVWSQTQTEMNEEACSKFKKANTEMKAVYQQILAANAENSNFITALRDAQRAWIAFRDAHIQAIYPDPNPQAAYGSVYPMCHCITLERLTSQRTAELRALWIEGQPEGEVCLGSSPIKGTSRNPTRKR